MTKEQVDGNLYFLNKYMDEQPDPEYDSEVSDKYDFTGEELYTLLEGSNLEETIVKLTALERKYPDADFYLANKKLEVYIKAKTKLNYVKYVEKVAQDLYHNVRHWFDTKWLVRRMNNEELYIERLVEVVSDMVHDPDSFSTEDFVDIYTLAYELGDYIYQLNSQEKKVAYGVAREKRLASAKKGLEQAGITRELVLKSSPDEIYKLIVANTKTHGRDNRIQVIETVSEDIQDALWIDEATDEDVLNVYTDVYRLYNLPTASKNFLPTFQRISGLIEKRKHVDKQFKISGHIYKEERLVIYQTDNSWIVLGGAIRVFLKDTNDTYKMVFSKPLYEVRVRDLENIFHTIK